jgi:hypothetical protein
VIERARDPEHGDFATNAAMVNSKAAGINPRQLAEQLVAAIPAADFISEVSIAGPGFINFRVASDAQSAIVERILNEGEQFGRSSIGEQKKSKSSLSRRTQPAHCMSATVVVPLTVRLWLIFSKRLALMWIANTTSTMPVVRWTSLAPQSGCVISSLPVKS